MLQAAAKRADENDGGVPTGLECLVIDDNSFDRRLLRSAARGCKVPMNLTEVSTLVEARSALETSKPDLCLVDCGLPDGDGLDLARELRQDPRFAGLPIIVVSNSEGEEIVVEAMRAGARDYIVKRRLSSEALDRAVESALGAPVVQPYATPGSGAAPDAEKIQATLAELAQLKADVLRILSRSWSMVDEGRRPTGEDRQVLSELTRGAVISIDDMTLDLATGYDSSPSVPVDCNAILSSCKRDLGDAIEARGAVVSGERLPQIHFVPSQMRLLFQQLVLHGLRFAGFGLAPEIEFGGGNAKDGSTILWYRDRGINLAARLQADRRALGNDDNPKDDDVPSSFGLSLCQRAVERNGGRFSIFGEEDGGCRVVIRFSPKRPRAD